MKALAANPTPAVNRRLATSIEYIRRTLEWHGATIGEHRVLSGPLIVENAERDYHNHIIGNNVHIGRGPFVTLRRLYRDSRGCCHVHARRRADSLQHHLSALDP